MAETGKTFGIFIVVIGFSLVLGAAKIPQPLYEFARGDNISLPCTFTPPTPPNRLFSIRWSADTDVENTPPVTVGSFFIGGHYSIHEDYDGRASLVVDVDKGQATLKLNSITSKDSRVYYCVIIYSEDETFDNTKLTVLVAPSIPNCGIQGKAEYGQNINITCKSQEGTPAPTYTWRGFGTQNNPRPLPPKSTQKDGVLSLFNISMTTSGYFICTSANKIRSATCNVTLAVMPPSMGTASTAIIIGIVAAVVLLVAVIIGCCCYRKKKRRDEEYAMGVHEGKFTDKEPQENGQGDYRDDHENTARSEEGYETNPRPSDNGDGRSDYTDRRSDYDDRRRDYDDRRSDYDDRRSDYSDRRRDNDDRRRDYDDRRRDYDDRRSDYDDRRSDYDDRQERYDDRRDHYDDRYDDPRDRYDDDYDNRRNRSDDRPPSVPPNKPDNIRHND